MRAHPSTEMEYGRVCVEEFETPERDYHLGIGSAGHSTQTGWMLEAVRWVVLAERPKRALA
ncbi:hypothetical protein SY88_11540 [Clostridiales bacterium PH28_bin88]|nr:hypothetical protein SY88_11540 [Clostridiales bacterium PH28_bin88]